MTKEEAIVIIDSLNPGVIIKTTASDEKIKEAIKMAIEALSQPSLPSNLDEAAENCTYCDHAYARESFKEGAEWMAGQGVSMIINDDTEWADVDSFIHKNVDGGSIIQIRRNAK